MTNDDLTLVLGASPNPERYAYKAVERLRAAGRAVVALGARQGRIADVPILTDPGLVPKPVHTVSLYLGPENQARFYDWILKLRPRRVIFNPGTENPPFERTLKEHGVNVQHACTLVMLSTGTFDRLPDND
ncbi:MAG: CoA-binding protein [Bacteroidia bacterium]|nr:CoA-binding protein [Bacteroidia bacterium]